MSNVQEIEKQEDFNDAIADGRTVVDFWATWCGPCRQFAPHFDKASDISDSAKFVAVDVDKAPWAVSEYGFRSVPTVALFEDGVFVKLLEARSVIPLLNEIRS